MKQFYNFLIFSLVFQCSFGQISFEESTIINHSYFINDVSQLSYADLDGDGDQDILASSPYQISWIENSDGLGNYIKPIKITDDEIDYPVITLDVDNDGDLDVVTVSALTFKLIWYENTDGFGNFISSQIISNENINFGPLIATDIDNDGDMDIVNGGNELVWYENINGSNTFIENQMPYPYGSFISIIIAKDIDNDGDDDLVLLENSDDIFYQLNIDGLGNFGPKQYTITDLNNVSSVNLADIDNDNDLDLIALSDFGNSLFWHENTDGLGDFSVQQSITTITTGFNSLHTSDLDGDNDIDIVLASVDNNQVIWLENTNVASNFIENQFSISNKFGTSVVIPVNVDSDGDMDLISFSFLENRISLYKNESNTGNFTEQVLTPSVEPLLDIASADIDGNGSIDILSVQNRKVAWYKNNNGEFAYRSQNIITSELDNAWHVDTADIDSDGAIDVVATSAGSEDKVVWYKNIDGLGNFSSENIIVDNLGSTFLAKLGDVDGDGDQDVVVFDNGSEEILWCENLDGLGNFSAPILAVSGFNFSVEGGSLLRDLDNDGDLDIITSSTQDDLLVWFRNNDGQGSFSGQLVIEDANFMQSAIAVDDIDMDGDLDIVSKNALRIRWYENDDAGNFTIQHIVNSDNRQVDAIEILDIDNDGDNDIVVGSNNSGNGLSWFENTNSNGDFGDEQLIYEGAFTTGELTSSDINNDGVKDLIVSGGYFEFNGPGTGYINWFDSQNSLSIVEFNQDKISLFPNPANDKINIKSDVLIEAVSIFDFKGTLIKSKELTNSSLDYQIDVKELSMGIYFIEIQSGESKIVKKFIKN
ncbi:T9SS type A sorting domain-containing protein [uncultured Winogradskyella sp.]|uniref:T9SS type A sorting domain-containing protein n=1 Tax=uncultured Winogradskyella sp. TaxID=395353 RepID=UPI00262BE9E3|nr:T9SS type A sorting domain-containing protein [uncultured Winogradskyella sp.]